MPGCIRNTSAGKAETTEKTGAANVFLASVYNEKTGSASEIRP